MLHVAKQENRGEREVKMRWSILQFLLVKFTYIAGFHAYILFYISILCWEDLFVEQQG